MHTHRHYHHRTADYTMLLLILAICFLTFMRVAGVLYKQIMVGGLAALSYWMWGIFHHLHEGNLHWKIMVEYTSFALLGFTTLWLLLVLLI